MIKVKLEKVRIFDFNPYRDKKTDKLKASMKFIDMADKRTLDYFTTNEDCVRELEVLEDVELDVDIELKSSKFGLQLGNIISVN